MALNTAIRHLKTGNLRKAHDVVQNDPSEFGCWAHGIVHLIEGDVPADLETTARQAASSCPERAVIVED